jgi:hypothetical protein
MEADQCWAELFEAGTLRVQKGTMSRKDRTISVRLKREPAVEKFECDDPAPDDADPTERFSTTFHFRVVWYGNGEELPFFSGSVAEGNRRPHGRYSRTA